VAELGGPDPVPAGVELVVCVVGDGDPLLGRAGEVVGPDDVGVGLPVGEALGVGVAVAVGVAVGATGTTGHGIPGVGAIPDGAVEGMMPPR
jgi:hypothetical protein